MAIKAKMTTTGFDEWIEALSKAGEDIDAITDEAIIAGCDILAAGMHERVAKDTGNLDEHIGRSEPKRDGDFHYAEVGVLNADADTARYGTVQEYGSADTPAKPYVRPTLDHDMGMAHKAILAKYQKRGSL